MDHSGEAIPIHLEVTHQLWTTNITWASSDSDGLKSSPKLHTCSYKGVQPHPELVYNPIPRPEHKPIHNISLMPWISHSVLAIIQSVIESKHCFRICTAYPDSYITKKYS